jgi:hypothetical protein
MKSFLKIIFLSCTLSLMTTAVYASAGDFVGTWKNLNPSTRGIVQVTVAPDMSMHLWGACTPTPGLTH